MIAKNGENRNKIKHVELVTEELEAIVGRYDDGDDYHSLYVMGGGDPNLPPVTTKPLRKT